MTKLTKLTIECIDDIESLKGIWNTVIEKIDDNNVFLTYEWLSCWLKVYTPNKKQFILCIRENESVIALAPLIIITHIEFGVPLKRLQFIGYRSGDYMDFIIIKYKKRCIDLIFDYINDNSQKWDYCELYNISGESGNLPFLRSDLSSRNQLFSIFKNSICPYIKMQSDIETYLKQQKYSLRRHLNRGERELKAIGNLTFVNITDQKEALSELPLFFDILLKRERLVDRQGTDQSNKNLQEVFKMYIENDGMWLNVNFCKLCIDDKPIAYHFGFQYGKKIYWYKPTFDINYLHQTPGKLLMKNIMEYAMKNKFDEFDLLQGDEPYKFQWTDEYRESYCLFFSSERFKSKLLFYYFLKIRPRLKAIKNYFIAFKK